jgi:4-amino-4-deoxy-L-arabinose transferase-like glycosyltransferase
LEQGKPRIIWLLALYFLLSLLTRVALSGGLELDESEQLVLTQVIRWGYGPQPPLYTWLQTVFLSVFGTNIFALALMKNVLLLGTYVCVYLIAKETLAESKSVHIAVLSLFLSPQFGWESHRTLTNTVLATAAAACLILIILFIRRKPTVFRYALLGCVAGCGILAKYNFFLLPAALVLACLSLDRWRPIIFNRRILISIVTGAAVCAGHLLWIIGNLEKAAAFSKKLDIARGPLLLTYAEGVLNLAAATIGLFWPLFIVYLLLFVPARKSPFEAASDHDIRALMGRTILIILAFCLVFVLATRLTRFNDRWLAPLLFFLPIYIVWYFRDRITMVRYRVFLSLAACVLVLMMALFPGRALFASRTGKVLRYNYPYSALTSQITEAGFDGGNIFAEDHRVGGNMRLHFPESAVNVPGRIKVPIQSKRKTLVVWDATDSDLVPPRLLDYVRVRTNLSFNDSELRYVAAPMLHFEGMSMRLGYYILGESNDQSPESRVQSPEGKIEIADQR